MSGFSEVGTAEGTLTLPIELISFTGATMFDGNLLAWSTASEQNSNYFSLERSSDGNQFSGIAQVGAAHNSTATRSYQYLDAHPANRKNFYRLKIVNEDA